MKPNRQKLSRVPILYDSSISPVYNQAGKEKALDVPSLSCNLLISITSSEIVSTDQGAANIMILLSMMYIRAKQQPKESMKIFFFLVIVGGLGWCQSLCLLHPKRRKKLIHPFPSYYLNLIDISSSSPFSFFLWWQCWWGCVCGFLLEGGGGFGRWRRKFCYCIWSNLDVVHLNTCFNFTLTLSSLHIAPTTMAAPSCISDCKSKRSILFKCKVSETRITI